MVYSEETRELYKKYEREMFEELMRKYGVSTLEELYAIYDAEEKNGLDDES